MDVIHKHLLVGISNNTKNKLSLKIRKCSHTENSDKLSFCKIVKGETIDTKGWANYTLKLELRAIIDAFDLSAMLTVV